MLQTSLDSYPMSTASDLTITPLPAFADNYIWCLQRGGEAVVVDPGDAAPVLAHLAAHALELAAILVTHHHADHQGGVAELLAQRAVPVYGPGNESITGCSNPLWGGEEITVLGLPFTVMAVPGHTRGHLAYHGEGALFCGDTLFGAGCGKLFEGTARQLFDALQHFAALPDDTLMYCAHEYTASNLRFSVLLEPDNPDVAARVAATAAARAQGVPTVPSTLRLERLTNPFLRVQQPVVVAAACAHGAKSADPLAVFTLLRQWRDRI
jgi:hydroxyacylglutathione hydrolase